MHVLVLGANGLLGSNVLAAALARGWTASGTYHTTEPEFETTLIEFDVRKTAAFATILDRTTPDVIFNCAAMTDVDACEQNPGRAYEVNAAAPEALAEAAAERNIGFVHVSTDYVFDGKARTPYVESADANPIQVYGASKRAGERAVAEAHDETLLTRLSFVYGHHRSTGGLVGFPAWVRERLTAAEQTPLFTDQHVSPTRAGQAGTTLLDLVEFGEQGLFHVASHSCVTPYEFGQAIAQRLSMAGKVLAPGSLERVDRPAPRPKYTCLATDRVARALGREQPSLETDLDALSFEDR
jgi:dTDP-4-dehydrorhamnose reductase